MIHVPCFEVDLWELGTSSFAAQMNLYGTVEHQQRKTTDEVNWQEFRGDVFAPGAASLHKSLTVTILHPLACFF